MNYNDNFLDYSVVIESQTEPNQGFELLHEEKTANGLSFLRFKACLQTFGSRNRNRRLWLSKWMKMMLAATEVQELLREGGIPGENQLIKQIVYNERGKVDKVRKYEYDSNGVCIRRLNYNANGTLNSYRQFEYTFE